MKKSSSNLWSQCSCNRLVAERIESRLHAQHIHALTKGCRSVSDHSAPERFPHLENKVNTRKQQENRAAEIQLENRHLLQKMLAIDTKPSPFSAEALEKSRIQPRSVHGAVHRRELDRITYENQGLLKRLQAAKSEFDMKGLEEMEMDRQAMKHRMLQNSCAGRPHKLPMPGKLVMSTPNLPRLGREGARFREDDWARLTNNELDKKLVELEQNQGANRDLA